MSQPLVCLFTRGLDPAQILDRCGLKLSDREPVPHPWEPLNGATLGTWYLITGGDEALSLVEESSLRELSAGCAVVAVQGWDTTMWSSVEQWDDGRCRWRIVHDPEQGVRHLEVTGEPPSELAALQAAAGAEQDRSDRNDEGVDHIYGVGMNLVERLTGCAPDRSAGVVSAFYRLDRVDA